METEEFQNDLGSYDEARVIALDDVLGYLKALDAGIRVKISAAIRQLGTEDTEGLLIKPLKGKLMELSVKQQRVIFFRAEAVIYVIDVFKKQSRKTPQRIIKRAEKIYKKFG